MMGIGLQDVIVAALVAVALAYLVRRRRRKQPKPEIVSLGRAPKRNGTPSPPGPALKGNGASRPPAPTQGA